MLTTDVRSIAVLIAVTSWHQIARLAPYMLAGVLLAAALGQVEMRRWLAWLDRAHLASIGGAACLGMLSPLSTLGTVPLLAQRVRNGASPGPAIAFLCASSMLNPQLFFLVLGGLGARMALLHLTGILALSLSVGWIAARLPATCLRPVTALSSSVAAKSFSWSRLIGDLIRMLDWIGLTFITGVLLAAAIQVLTPAEWVTWLAGQDRWLGVPLAGIMGVPLYTCGGSAVPVLSELVDMGLSRGMALAFLLSGPATRVTALAALGSLLDRRALALYVATIVLGATVLGLLLGPLV